MLKKRLIILGILICIFLFFSIVGLSNDVKYDFRKTNWGMSKEQVKATEDKEPDWEDDAELSYKVTISGKSGKDFPCNYYFSADKLYSSAYGLGGRHTNNNLYIDDYEELKEILTKEYGKPKTDKVIWKRDVFKDDKSYWGTAVVGGDLSCSAQWETPTTEINLKLFGEDWRIILIVSYESKELTEWARENNEKIYAEIKKSEGEEEKDTKQEGLEEKRPIILSGFGQEASEKFVLEEGLVRFNFLYKGQHNFIVWLLDNTGKKVELLVNKTGYFDGSKAIRIDKTGIYLLDISADEYWLVTIFSG
ncbi:MAG: hypothetical protein IMZ60_03175 [Actinobacteria bacterium]|nr:hypothetical protein [Actinomycetota bacterium]